MLDFSPNFESPFTPKIKELDKSLDQKAFQTMGIHLGLSFQDFLRREYILRVGKQIIFGWAENYLRVDHMILNRILHIN